MNFPEPVIPVAIEPKTKADQDKMGIAISKAVLKKILRSVRIRTKKQAKRSSLVWVSFTLKFSLTVCFANSKSKQTLVSRKLLIVKRSVTAAKVEGKFVRQSGGRGQFGHCWVEFSPQEPGTGFVFENKTVGGSIPREFIAPIQAGIEESMKNGVIAGFPLVDIKAVVVDGSYHDVDSSEMAFKIAGSMALKAAKEKCNPVLA